MEEHCPRLCYWHCFPRARACSHPQTPLASLNPLTSHQSLGTEEPGACRGCIADLQLSALLIHMCHSKYSALVSTTLQGLVFKINANLFGRQTSSDFSAITCLPVRHKLQIVVYFSDVGMGQREALHTPGMSLYVCPCCHGSVCWWHLCFSVCSIAGRT